MALKDEVVKSIKAVFAKRGEESDRFNCGAFPDNLGVISPTGIHPQSKTSARQMTSDRWNKIKELFSSAQVCAEDQRSDFLARACEGDDELRDEVEKLLAAAREDDSFLVDSAAEEFAGLFDFDDLEDDASIPSAKSPPRFAAGTIFNERYRIESLLGRGGMGEVYLADDTRINRRVALKVLHSDLVSSKESLRRFGLETQAISALNHPHIMTIYEFDSTSDGTVFFVAEHVDGKTLNRLIGAELRTETALDIAIQVCSALSAAHEAGITHRDIKPENIMVRRDGYVKVLDFGLAKLTEPRSENASGGSEDPTRALNKTKPGQVMGTAAYMSPEQARGLHVDARTDIWSVGAVVFEMLTGKRPFVGETEADVMVAVLLSEPAPLSSFSQNIPSELEWIVSKSLAKDVDARYQTAKELRADLEKVKKRIHFNEEHGRISRSDAEDEEAVLHSTAGGAVPTAGGETKRTNDGRDESAAEPSFFSSPSFQSAIGHAQKHKLGTGVAALMLVALLSAVAYYAFVASARGPAIDSIAVLPFENRTGDPNLSYVSDGLSDSMIDRLSQLPQLKVISRKSSFRFRGEDIDIRDAANQLGVRSIVMGEVTRVGDELVVRVDVVDAIQDLHLAGGQYRRKIEDLVGLESEVSRTATEQLRLKLTNAQSERIKETATDNSEAYRYYLSGLVELNGPNDVRGNALDYFERAIALDPDFAAAHAEIAWVYWGRANEASDPRELMPKAKAAVARALELDPELAKAHVMQAMVDEYEFDWQGAEREYRRGIELSPNLDFARNNFAYFLSIRGRQDEALAQLEEQRMRDPINDRLALLQKGIILTQARRFDDALKAYQEAQVAEPSRDIPNFSLGYAYGGKGLYNEAAGYYKKSIAALGGDEKYSQPLVYLAATYARIPEKRGESRAILAKIESMRGYSSPALLAAVYSALDEHDKAMELLEEAYIKRDVLLRFVGTGYEYDGLRSDPRFADLLRRIGLADTVK